MLPESGFPMAANCRKLEKRQWYCNLLTWHHRQLFLWWCVSLVMFSYLCKFHVDIMSGSGVMTNFVYKGLTRNLEIANTTVWVLPISGDWSKLGIPNLARMSLIKTYWTLQNVSATACRVSELLREKQQRGWGTITPPHPD